MSRGLAVAAAAAFLTALVSAGAALPRAAWNQFPSKDLVGLRGSVSFTVPTAAKASIGCPALTGLDAGKTFTINEQSSATGWTIPAATDPGQIALTQLRWSSAPDVGDPERLAFAQVSLPLTAPASLGAPANRYFQLFLSTSPHECLDSRAYRVSPVGSPVGTGYPILWRLGWGFRATGGLGCGFLNVTTTPSPDGTVITETFVLTDAVAAESTTYEELACSSGRVVAATTDPAQTGADLTPNLTVAKIIKAWNSDLSRHPTGAPTKQALATARATVLANLRAASVRYHFTVVSVDMVHQRQLAPLIVVNTMDKEGVRSSLGAILDATLSKPGAAAHTRAYVAYFFEVRDRNGLPFLAASAVKNGGGQWAADGHFPFLHG